MLRNFVLIASRTFKRKAAFSTLNVLGLSIGLACCLLAGAYVVYEKSYDTFHKEYNHIARVDTRWHFPNGMQLGDTTPIALKQLALKVPGVEAATHFEKLGWGAGRVLKVGEKVFREDDVFIADSNFARVFSFEVLHGDLFETLSKANQLAVSESLAKKYFDRVDVVGERMEINESEPLLIGAVIADPPLNSSIQYSAIMSWETYYEPTQDSWQNANWYTYLLLHPDADLAEIEKRLNQEVEVFIGAENMARLKREVVLEPLPQLWLNSQVTDSSISLGNQRYVDVVTYVALLILLIACINYVNMSTARAVERAKEVGMRKTLGAFRGQIVLQFIVEAYFFVLLSLVLANLMAYLLMPYFKNMTGSEVYQALLFSSPLLTAEGVLFVVVGLVAGAYPAFVLSGFKPVTVLKGKFSHSKAGNRLRKGLVVLQMGISYLLLVSAFTVSSQLDYFLSKPAGFERDQLLKVAYGSNLLGKYNVVKSSFQEMSAVNGVTAMAHSPVDIQAVYSIRLASRTESDALACAASPIHDDFVKTMGLELLAGRDLNPRPDDPTEDAEQFEMIINESAMKELGLTLGNAVGTRCHMSGRVGDIVGVVKDFHYQSMHQQIGPAVFFNRGNWLHEMLISFTPGSNTQAMLDELQSRWREVYPATPFTYEFVDERYAALYKNEQNTARTVKLLTVVAILMACIGLYGLSTYTALARAREVAIRKVLGAKPLGLFWLMTKEYALLAGTACVLAVPIGYFVLTGWLDNFSYHTQLSIILFLLPLVITFGVTLLTFTYQTLRTARLNPSMVLKAE